jgi:integrase
LKWENVDLVNGTILIDRQMQYQDSIVKLKPLKTRNAKRTIVMCSKLKVYFQNLFLCRERDATQRAKVRNQKQTFLEDIDGSTISSLDLVNSLPDGKIQTVNSIKYHSQLIKSTLKIEFKYHYLRHTFGTFLADLNTPAHLLCKQMGHGNIQVTQKYYIAFSENGIDVLRHNLNKI